MKAKSPVTTFIPKPAIPQGTSLFNGEIGTCLPKNTKIQHSDGPDHQDEAYEMHVHLVGLASESLQNAESFCQHAISFRFGFRIRSAAGHEKGCPAMKRCPAVDKTISGVEQLL